MGFGHDSGDMFWRPRLGYYTNPSKNAKFYLDRTEATSYNWWSFVKKINGKVVFNEYRYSSETSSHQYGVKKLLELLKIKIDITVSTRESLSKYSSLSQFLPALYAEVFKLKAQDKFRPGKYSSEDSIKELKDRIKVIRKAGGKYPKASIASDKAKAIKFEVDRKETIRLKRIDAARRVAAGRALLKQSWKNKENTNETRKSA